jgi:hypothetical protein
MKVYTKVYVAYFFCLGPMPWRDALVRKEEGLLITNMANEKMYIGAETPKK